MRSIYLLLLAISVPLHGGVFFGTVDCDDNPDSPVPPEENFCIQGLTRDGVVVTTQGIVHPMGYDGSGGTLNIDVCVETAMDPDNVMLIEPAKKAVRIWNDLIASTEQCRNCFLIEDSDVPQEPELLHAASTLLHELGHCAMGLDHSNLQFDPPGAPEGRTNTSFTMSYGGSPIGIGEGDDGIRGSLDDVQQAAGGLIPESVNWFRRSDNNPVVVDGTVIDITTYSRSIPNLPSGHDWSANANRDVAMSLGFENTHNVMYSAIARTQRWEGLTADGVNMVKMGMTGEDRMAGTADDYTIDLQFIDDCANAEVRITFLDQQPAIARCSARTERSFSQPNPLLARHYSIVPGAPKGTFVAVVLNKDSGWDFSVIDEVFSNGFEIGDTSDWSQTIP